MFLTDCFLASLECSSSISCSLWECVKHVSHIVPRSALSVRDTGRFIFKGRKKRADISIMVMCYANDVTGYDRRT